MAPYTECCGGHASVSQHLFMDSCTPIHLACACPYACCGEHVSVSANLLVTLLLTTGQRWPALLTGPRPTCQQQPAPAQQRKRQLAVMGPQASLPAGKQAARGGRRRAFGENTQIDVPQPVHGVR